MTAETFTPGDPVWIKSGGMAMTVAAVDLPLSVLCVWMGCDGKVNRARFDPIVLTKQYDWMHNHLQVQVAVVEKKDRGRCDA